MVNKLAVFSIGITLSCLWIVFPSISSNAQTADLSEKLWSGVGGKQNWDNARYFMFTCQEVPHKRASYLWDRQTGDCRFESETSDGEELVVLFNLNTTGGQVFVDEVLLLDKENADILIARAHRDFKTDAELLFLPVVQDGGTTTVSIVSEKLVGVTRHILVEVKSNATAYGEPIEGTIHLDAQSGRICEWYPKEGRRQGDYEVGGYKDIGGGVILPTRFSPLKGGGHITYPIAATLVHIEANKFTQP